MKNKKFLTVLVALVLAMVVSLTATLAVLGANNEVTVKLSENGSAVIETLPGELGNGDTLVIICDTEDGAFVNTESAPALSGVKYVVGDVTVTAGLDLATTAVIEDLVEVTGLGIAVEVEDSIELPENAAKLFGAYSSYVIGVGAVGFDANEVQVNDGKVVGFDVAVTMPAGVGVVVYDADYNVVPSTYNAGVVSFDGKLGEGYAIAPEMVAVVEGVGYPTLEEAIAVAEGSFDAPVAIIGEGAYVLDTDSQVIVGIAGDATVTVADGVFSYATEVTFEGEEYTAYALYNKDYLFSSIADSINDKSVETGISAEYAAGALNLGVVVEDLSDLFALDSIYDVIGAFAPIAVVGETIKFDSYVVFDGAVDMDAAKEFASSKLLTLEEIAALTSKTIATFDIEVTSGATVAVVPVSVAVDCTDAEFENLKGDAATLSEYVVITNTDGNITVDVDAVEIYKNAIAQLDEYKSLTAKEVREKINSLSVKEFTEKLEVAGLTGKYATVVNALTKIVNKISGTKYAGNLDAAIGMFDKDGDGIYDTVKTVEVTGDSLVEKLNSMIATQYPEFADYINVEEMVGNASMTFTVDVTVKLYATYTVTFVDENGVTLYEETIIDGEVPTFVGEVPSKDATSTAVFEFIGWTADGTTVYETLPALTENTVYTVVYEEVAVEGIDTTINPKSASVVFNGKMSVKFYVPKAALEVYENFYANVTITTVSGTETTQIVGTENGAYYQFVIYGIAAKQMSDNIAFEVVATRMIGETQITRTSEVKDYSVKQYAYNRLASDGATAAEKTLLVDFLNYGAAAQKYFGYKADALVNAELTEEQKGFASAEVPVLESHFAYEGQETELVLFKGASLMFVDNISIKFIINFNYYRGTTSDVHLVINCNGNETIVYGDELVANGSFYTYTFDGLAIKDLRSPVTVTVVETATGNVLSGPLTYSAETYAYNKQSSTDANLVELLNALMKFAVSAEAFL